MSYYQGTSAGVDAPTCDSGEVVSSLPVPECLIVYALNAQDKHNQRGRRAGSNR